MLLNEIVQRVNHALAGEILTYDQILYHLDDTIDAINKELGSKFPAFSELDSSALDYDAFPDKWIRMVVIPGAAHFFFMADEEGITTAVGYEQRFLENLQSMIDKYLMLVPDEYIDNVDTGLIFKDENDSLGGRGLFVNGTELIP